MAKTGFFITVEGGEGVGKSVFTEKLAESLQKRDPGLVVTREPGGTPVAQAIRELFLHPPAGDELTAKAELFLVSAARTQHVSRKIAPALARGSWVLCDRFFDSSRVYQGHLGKVSQAELEAVLAVSVEGVAPDLTFLLDCDTDLVMARIGRRNGEAIEQDVQDRFDAASRDYHIALRNGFLAVARSFPERIVVLDASRAPDALIRDALQFIDQRSSRTGEKP